MKKFLMGVVVAITGSLLVSKIKKTEDVLDAVHDYDTRPILKKIIDDNGLVIFKVENPSISGRNIEDAQISYYGADLCINPEEIEGEFHSIIFPEMKVEGSHVYVNILAEYYDNEVSVIDQILSMNLSDKNESRCFTHQQLKRYLEGKEGSDYPISLSLRFHAKQNGNYEVTKKKAVSRYPLTVRFNGDANTRLIMDMWSRIDVEEVSDVLETVYHVNKK